MKRQEKLELKKLLLPMLGGMFPSQAEEFKMEYPFLLMEDEAIEDDIELPESTQKASTIRDIGKISASSHQNLKQIANELSGGYYDGIIQRINGIARGKADYQRGLYFTGGSVLRDRKMMRWMIQRDSHTSFLLAAAVDGDEASLERLGYVDVLELLNVIQNNDIMKLVEEQYKYELEEYLRANNYVKTEGVTTVAC